MSTINRKKSGNWGGARPNPGRKTGATKTKICVSVDAKNWETAISHWKDKRSRLIDALLKRYVSKELSL